MRRCLITNQHYFSKKVHLSTFMDVLRTKSSVSEAKANLRTSQEINIFHHHHLLSIVMVFYLQKLRPHIYDLKSIVNSLFESLCLVSLQRSSPNDAAYCFSSFSSCCSLKAGTLHHGLLLSFVFGPKNSILLRFCWKLSLRVYFV